MRPPDAVRRALSAVRTVRRGLPFAPLLSVPEGTYPPSAKSLHGASIAQVHENSAVRSELPPLDISLRQFVELVVRVAHVQCACCGRLNA